MNGMIFRSFRKRNSSQKNTNTVCSEYSYSGIVPKESAPNLDYQPTGELNLKIEIWGYHAMFEINATEINASLY